MQPFGFEHDPVPEFDPSAHGIDDSHCRSLRPKTEYRDRETGRRLRTVPDDSELFGSRWEMEGDDGWFRVEDPHFMEHVLMDDDSDAAYYLHLLSHERGHGVDDSSVMAVEEPMRSALVHWTGLARVDHWVSPPYSMWVDDELGLVVVWEQLWAYGVVWISPESLEIVHERVRQMKADGTWREPHPNGATMVFRTA
jgi:hypothetical protein